MTRLLLRKLNGVEGMHCRLSQEQQVAALVDNANGHLDMRFLGFCFRGATIVLMAAQIQILLAREFSGHSHELPTASGE
jgi:hypothetical protein